MHRRSAGDLFEHTDVALDLNRLAENNWHVEQRALPVPFVFGEVANTTE